ncbi:Redoxin domain protein [Thermovibrio ammonificans HB-1]|uniref:Thiol peroxidase n=1 Tax=Thermovibrio ammonificans (strain DSM 15698 / JCM 12110 / HB-1) TaxID=648996 RepID=E8T4Y2_THEA1|nr:thiol peroxidase [Thermovibrio ammonificans]ADU97514.1 Redoxin domain protein [Thermovibrio ammonificans HB-1]
MAETVTLKGNPVTLAGPVVNVGDEAPVACVVKSDLLEKQIGGKKEKVQLIITVPSLDTPVCETETRKFNEMLKDLDVDVTVVSMDLPFAEKRFCESFNVSNVDVASDFRYRDMEKFGVLIAEGALKGLLARAVFIVDKSGKVCYKQLVPEITQEPNYDEVLSALKSVL